MLKMKRGLVRNLSANALQLLLNQGLGLLIFYILSFSLSKTDFGQVNLALAILLAAFNILSLGIDQLVVKKIASGDDIGDTLSIYIEHVLISGSLFYFLLWTGSLLVHADNTYSLLIGIGAGKLMIFFSAPFKQVANGTERFRLLACMSVISNVVRGAALLLSVLFYSVTVRAVTGIFIAGDLAELLLCIYLFKRATKTRIVIHWNRTAYFKLLRESLPQTGVVIITSALSRLDWIFIGLIVSAGKLAEYSFAYKVFEAATLPLLILAPLLITRFTKLFQQQEINKQGLNILLRYEIMLAAFTALLLTMCWIPVIDAVTAGRYGFVNAKTIVILAFCMPLLYINNFLWTIGFAQGRLKMIFRSFLLAFIVNAAADMVLIPLYKKEGAAFAYLLSCLVQAIYYLRKNNVLEHNAVWKPLVVCTACAVCSGLLCKSIFSEAWAAILFSIPLYFILLFAAGHIRPEDRKAFIETFNW